MLSEDATSSAPKPECSLLPSSAWSFGTRAGCRCHGIEREAARSDPSQEGGEEEDAEISGDPEIVGSEEMSAEQPTEERQPPLNIDDFAGSVARLIMNFESLMDPVTVILNRSMNFLDNRYDRSVVDDFTEIMAQQYGMELNPIDDRQPPPAAVGAGPSPGA